MPLAQDSWAGLGSCRSAAVGWPCVACLLRSGFLGGGLGATLSSRWGTAPGGRGEAARLAQGQRNSSPGDPDQSRPHSEFPGWTLQTGREGLQHHCPWAVGFPTCSGELPRLGELKALRQVGFPARARGATMQAPGWPDSCVGTKWNRTVSQAPWPAGPVSRLCPPAGALTTCCWEQGFPVRWVGL